MMTRVLGLLGSPRLGRNTDTLLDACLAGAAAAGAETSKLAVANLTIKPCLSCYACARTGECAVKGDEMQSVYAELARADVILLASPLYFGGVSAQLKAVIDRAQLFWSRQNDLKLPALLPSKRRLGALICTGGAPNRSGNNFLPAIATAKLWFQALEVEWQGELAAANTDRLPVPDRTDLLEQGKQLGVRLMQEASAQ